MWFSQIILLIGGRDMENHRLSNEEKDELLDMYDSSSEMHTGAVIRIDLSNRKIMYSSNFKRVTGFGKMKSLEI